MEDTEKVSVEAKPRRKRTWLIVLLAVMGVCALVAAGAGIYLYRLRATEGGNERWGPEYSTAGMQLTLTEVGRERREAWTEVTYSMRTTGMPTHTTYTLRLRGLPGDTTRSSGPYEVNQAGKIFNPQTGDVMETFVVGQLMRGEPVSLALVTEDGSIQVFARTIPFPIVAENGRGCSLSVELADRSGQTFIIQGRGFEPSEALASYDRSEDEIITSSATAGPDGSLRIISLPAVTGKASGTAEQRLTGRDCDLMVEYEWGAAATILQ